MKKLLFLSASTLALYSSFSLAQLGTNLCLDLPSHEELTAALESSVYPAVSNGGLDLNMWATLVANDGTVCAVTKTGEELNDQWLGSRVISAQKANTANAFSLNNSLALSTANLYSAVQPGGSLFGLQLSNPIATDVAYEGNSMHFGDVQDPMRGQKIGGVNVFGGGLALYDVEGNLLGAVGVSGDTSCADHNVAWRVRDILGLDHVPTGLTVGDNIIFDIEDGVSPSGFGHPFCLDPEAELLANETVLEEHPLGPNP